MKSRIYKREYEIARNDERRCDEEMKERRMESLGGGWPFYRFPAGGTGCSPRTIHIGKQT